MRHLAWIVGALAAASIVALWWLGSALSAPANRTVRPPPPELALAPITFASGSGGELGAWIAAGAPGRGSIVLAHAVRGDRAQMLGRARFLLAAGYGVLLFDAQAHGESAGDRITFGLREAHDARAAVATARARLPAGPVAYLGVSQGGAAALLGSEPLAVEALIVEAVYPALREAIRDRIAIRLGPLADAIAPLLIAQLPLRLGVAADAIAPIEGIRRVRAPLLLVAGDRDRHTPLAESERLFAAAEGPKEMWILHRAAHVDFHAFAPVEYERRVLEFLARAFAPHGRSGP
jgi:fermentation-respiration switch protein FrsA (DUF1100 family)